MSMTPAERIRERFRLERIILEKATELAAAVAALEELNREEVKPEMDARMEDRDPLEGK
jgi:hypothetical protein